MSIFERSDDEDLFSLDAWYPFSNIDSHFPLNSPRFSPSCSSSNASLLPLVRMDWKETPKAHVIKADLPGIKKEELKVEVAHRKFLEISVERPKEKEEETDIWHCRERRSREFYRRFRLKNANMDEINAAVVNGVLTVTVPKKEVTSGAISDSD
jgi:HSP20 family protein